MAYTADRLAASACDRASGISRHDDRLTELGGSRSRGWWTPRDLDLDNHYFIRRGTSSLFRRKRELEDRDKETVEKDPKSGWV